MQRENEMENLLIGSARHLELEGGLRDLEYLMLNLPYKCNLNCQKCCNDPEERLLHSSTEPLTLKEIANIIIKARDLGVRVLTIMGEGEPFLDENIKGIVERTSGAGLIPYIFTNGTMLDADTVRFLKFSKASLVIGIDSLDETKYDELTRSKGFFQKVYKNVQNVREQFKDTHS